MVVVNHHLFTDMVVRSGFAELIPKQGGDDLRCPAHQLPDIASQYFGQSLSSRQLLDLAKDITIAYRTEAERSPSSCKVRRPAGPELQGFSSAARRARLSRQFARPAGGQQHSTRALLLLDDALELCYDVAKLSLGRSAAAGCPPLNARRSIVRGSSD